MTQTEKKEIKKGMPLDQPSKKPFNESGPPSDGTRLKKRKQEDNPANHTRSHEKIEGSIFEVVKGIESDIHASVKEANKGKTSKQIIEEFDSVTKEFAHKKRILEAGKDQLSQHSLEDGDDRS